MGTVVPEGYTIWMTDTRRGRCSYGPKTITVPLWTLGGPPSGGGDARYVQYYLAHECAHAVTFEDTRQRGHGVAFMANFMSLCPNDLRHYELDYKPRLAAAAGISKTTDWRIK
jgi:hypothetical protein